MRFNQQSIAIVSVQKVTETRIKPPKFINSHILNVVAHRKLFFEKKQQQWYV